MGKASLSPWHGLTPTKGVENHAYLSEEDHFTNVGGQDVTRAKPIKHNIVRWAVCTRLHKTRYAGYLWMHIKISTVIFLIWGMPRLRSPIRGLMSLVFAFSLAVCLLALSKIHLISLKMLSGHIHCVIYLPEIKNIPEH